MPRRKGAARAIDVEMLEESFDLVAPQGDELIRTFYENLFETAPSVQPLFAEVDMERQRQALLNSSSSCVNRYGTSTTSSRT
jgi:hemoglobin-like flavoprotein